MKTKIPQIFVILILLIAIADLPYGFYTFVKISVCGIAIYTSYIFLKNNSYFWCWLFILIAVLFNPIIPIYLDRGLWAIIDITTAIVFFISISRLNIRKL